jgi:hypothetical protein
MSNNSYTKLITVTFFYIFLTLILTAPLILYFSSSIYGYPGDHFASLWWDWWQQHAAHYGLKGNFSLLIGAPFGSSTGDIVYPFWNIVLRTLGSLLGTVTARNLMIFLSFPLSGLFIYLVMVALTGSDAVGLVAGVIFAFSPYHFAQAISHMSLSQVEWLALLVFFMVLSRRKHRLRNAFYLAIAFILISITNYYYGFFAVIFVLGYLIFSLVWSLAHRQVDYKDSPTVSNKRRVSYYWLMILIAALIATVVILPTIIPLVKKVVSHQTQYSRNFSQLFVYSARLQDYFVPPIFHPVFGKYVSRFLSLRLHNSNFFEQTLFLGYTTIVLSLVGIFYIVKRAKEEQKFWGYFFLFWAVAAFLLSASPWVKIAGVKIFLPSYFIYELAPYFRVYARFGLHVILSLSILAGFGFFFIYQKISSRFWKVALLSAILLLVVAEFINFPPPRITNINQVTKKPVYKWLKKQPGNFIVTEFPLASRIEPLNSYYLLGQSFHKKPLFNGATLGSTADKLREEIVDTANPKTAKVLKFLGVKYVIVNRWAYAQAAVGDKLSPIYGGRYTVAGSWQYNQGHFPSLSTKQFKLIKSFKDEDVYLVTAKAPKALAYFADNFGKLEEFYGHLWRWMENDGKLIIDYRGKKAVSVNLSTTATSFARQRQLEVILNGRSLGKFLIKPKLTKLVLSKIKLKPGKNLIIFKSRPGAQQISKKLHNFDTRFVSVAISSINLNFGKHQN